VPLSNDTLGDILALVDRLTLPHKTAVLVEDDDGAESKKPADSVRDYCAVPSVRCYSRGRRVRRVPTGGSY
jgi:hypothetical protein